MPECFYNYLVYIRSQFSHQFFSGSALTILVLFDTGTSIPTLGKNHDDFLSVFYSFFPKLNFFKFVQKRGECKGSSHDSDADRLFTASQMFICFTFSLCLLFPFAFLRRSNLKFPARFVETNHRLQIVLDLSMTQFEGSRTFFRLLEYS